MSASATSPSAFLDPATLSTFAVASAAVFAVTVTARRAFGINHPALPLVPAAAISFALAASAGTLGTVTGWLIALLNSCLLYCSAVGANESATAASGAGPARA